MGKYGSRPDQENQSEYVSYWQYCSFWAEYLRVSFSSL